MCAFIIKTRTEKSTTGDRKISYHLRDIKHIILDLDGTICLDDQVFPETRPFLTALGELDIGHTFITNRSSLSTSEHETKLRAMGIKIGVNDVYTSGRATIDFIRTSHPDVNRLFVLGTPSLKNELIDAGFKVSDETTAEPDAVVVGFDTTLTFERLCHTAYLIKCGIPFFATHPDFFCPTAEPTVLIDCGAVCAALSLATGREPDAVLGKPHSGIIHGLLDRIELAPSHVAMVGDRLYTDMEMARKTGLLAILVLTGETTKDKAEQNQAFIDIVVNDLGELESVLRKAHT